MGHASPSAPPLSLPLESDIGYTEDPQYSEDGPRPRGPLQEAQGHLEEARRGAEAEGQEHHR